MLLTQQVSFVIPVYNEQESIPELIRHIFKLQKQIRKKKFEIIFVDDGSTDNSAAIIQKMQKKNANIFLYSFRKNMGKANALQTGFRYATGSLIITMDADLQDGVENIPNLIQKLNSGYDLVVGWKKIRHDPFNKRFPSKIFNLIVSKISGLAIHDFNSGLKIMRIQVARELRLYGELHRFIPFLADQRGFRVTEIPVNHHPRKYGKSKYGSSRFMRGIFDVITVTFLRRYGQSPLHFFGIIGAISFGLGIITGIYLSILHFSGQTIGRRPLLFLAILLVLAGLQVISIGLIGEMIVDKTSSQNFPIENKKSDDP